MRKPLMVVPMLGMGYFIAVTPSVWTTVICLIPFLSFCLIVASIRVMLKGKDDTP